MTRTVPSLGRITQSHLRQARIWLTAAAVVPAGSSSFYVMTGGTGHVSLAGVGLGLLGLMSLMLIVVMTIDAIRFGRSNYVQMAYAKLYTPTAVPLLLAAAFLLGTGMVATLFCGVRYVTEGPGGLLTVLGLICLMAVTLLHLVPLARDMYHTPTPDERQFDKQFAHVDHSVLGS